MPHDFTYLWNLKNKINQQRKQKQSHRHRKYLDGYQTVRWLGYKKAGGIKMCKLPVTKAVTGISSIA